MESPGDLFAVWNTLHDGVIDAVSGDVPGDLVITIGISYLCRVLPTQADQLRVTLRNCTMVRYEPFDEPPVHGTESLASLNIEVLSARRSGRAVEVVCTAGLLQLEYESVEVQLGEGATISQDHLEVAAERYWREWEKKTRG